MQSNQEIQQNTSATIGLPYIQIPDTAPDQVKPYVEYLYDSLNLKQSDTTFVFELKKIILPKESDSVPQKELFDHASVFFPYKSAPIKIVPVERNVTNYDWLTMLFILCLMILTWIRYEGGKRVSQLFKTVWAKHNLNQLLRDGNIISERITPGLMFIYIITISTLIINLTDPLNFNIPGANNLFLIFCFLAGVILILWLLKLVTIRVIGTIFKTKAETSDYLVTNIIFNITTGLAAMPFVFAGHYSENKILIMIALCIFIVGYLLKMVRSIFVGLSAQTFPIVYLFLYFCSLEIIPILVIYKLLL